MTRHATATRWSTAQGAESALSKWKSSAPAAAMAPRKLIPALLAALFGLTACAVATPSAYPQSAYPGPSFALPSQIILSEVPADAAHLDLSFKDQETSLSFEGWYYFIRATVSGGSVVLVDRTVGYEDAQALPPGEYTFLAYYRTCDGNCGSLDPPVEVCSLSKVLQPEKRYHLTVDVGSRECVWVSA